MAENLEHPVDVTSPEEVEKYRQFLIDSVRAVDAKRQEALDRRIVWYENAAGRRDVVLFGHYRKYLAKRPDYGRLLTPDEVAEEQQKVAQGAAARAAAEDPRPKVEHMTVQELEEVLEQHRVGTRRKQR